MRATTALTGEALSGDMMGQIKEGWRQLRDCRPGSRFREQHRRRHEGGQPAWRRPVFLTLGSLLVVAGVFLMPAPGPGFVVVFIGGLLLSRESLAVARFFDWLEMRLLRLLAWGRRTWRGMSLPARTAAIALVASAAGALGLAAFAVLRRM
jgi:uncharacterized protein (TIGR02611 family)